MVEIKKIEKDLHKRKSTFATREHDRTVYDEWHAERDIARGKGRLSTLIDRYIRTRTRATLIGAAIVALATFVAFAIILIVLFQRSFFMQEHVQLDIVVPAHVQSNEVFKVKLHYSNDNRADLNNAKMTLDFGQYFVVAEQQDFYKETAPGRGVITLNHIAGHADETVELVGHFIAPEEEVETARATLSYVPERTSTTYTTSAVGTTTVTSSPIVTDITTEKETVNGNFVDIVVHYRNTSDRAIEGLALSLTYPSGFIYQKATPTPRTGSDHIWHLPALPARHAGEIHIRGVANGTVGDVLRFIARVYNVQDENNLYAQSDTSVTIVATPIVITQRIEKDNKGIVYAGDRVTNIVTIKNQGDIPLRDVIVTMHLEGQVIDYENISLDDRGFYDQENRTIVWKASDLPELAVLNPGDVVSFSVYIPIVAKIPVDGEQSDRFTVATTLVVDSFDLPSAVRENKNMLSSALVLRVGAKMLADVQLKHLSGPLPPQEGTQTVYRVTLRAGVVNNDLADAVFRGGLQSGVSFAQEAEQDAEELVINKRTNIFTWNIGKLVHGTGVTRDYRTKSFDITFTPSKNQVGKTPLLLNNLALTAVDTFTGEEQTYTLEDILTANASGESTAVVVPRPAPAVVTNNTTSDTVADTASDTTDDTVGE